MTSRKKFQKCLIYEAQGMKGTTGKTHFPQTVYWTQTKVNFLYQIFQVVSSLEKNCIIYTGYRNDVWTEDCERIELATETISMSQT